MHAQADLPDNLFMKACMDCLCIDMLFNLAPTKKSDFDQLQSQHQTENQSGYTVPAYMQNWLQNNSLL